MPYSLFTTFNSAVLEQQQPICQRMNMPMCIKKFWDGPTLPLVSTPCIIPSPCCGQNLASNGTSHLGLGHYWLTLEDCLRWGWLNQRSLSCKEKLAWEKANSRLLNGPHGPGSNQIQRWLGAKTTDESLGYSLTRAWILLTSEPRRGPQAPVENYRWREDPADLHLYSSVCYIAVLVVIYYLAIKNY